MQMPERVAAAALQAGHQAALKRSGQGDAPIAELVTAGITAALENAYPAWAAHLREHHAAELDAAGLTDAAARLRSGPPAEDPDFGWIPKCVVIGQAEPQERPAHPLATAICGCPLMLDSKKVEHRQGCWYPKASVDAKHFNDSYGMPPVKAEYWDTPERTGEPQTGYTTGSAFVVNPEDGTPGYAAVMINGVEAIFPLTQVAPTEYCLVCHKCGEHKRGCENAEYLIWSHEANGWWGPGGAGYVPLAQAGRFLRADAESRCRTRTWEDSADAPPEVMVLAPPTNLIHQAQRLQHLMTIAVIGATERAKEQRARQRTEGKPA